MDASEFGKQRSTQLADFSAKYTDLKTAYLTSATNALKETDRPKQCVLIKNTLDANKKMSALVKSFVASLDPGTCKANPDLQKKLQDDLARYNKEHEEIQQGRDQLSGLKNAIERTREKTKDIADLFSWYAVLIGISVVFLIFVIVFRTGSSMFNAQPSAPVFPGSH